MPQIDRKMLVSYLQLGADMRATAQAIGIRGDAQRVREQIVEICQDESFVPTLLSGVPNELEPAVRSLWAAWRDTEGQGQRARIQQLRRIIRGIAQMAAAFHGSMVVAGQ